MKKKADKPGVDRRNFLKSAAVVGGSATLAATTGNLQAEQAPVQAANRPVGSAPVMPPEIDPPAHGEVLTVERAGSDFMVDVIKKLGFEYVAANPGASFRGLHESIVNYGGNKMPELLTCCHEESSVAMAHGYYAVENKPMLVMAHSTVGLQHASMAVYNAYAGGIPVFMILGNHMDATHRRPGAEWHHAVIDATAIVRDYIKWDDLPMSLNHFAESMTRAYKIMMTPPMLPVVIIADGDLQEHAIDPNYKLSIPKLTVDRAPMGDLGAIEEAARMLVGATNPVIIAGQATRSQEGMDTLVALAEALQAAVQDSGGNFPSHHRLRASGGAVRNADVILSLEHIGLWASVNSIRDQQGRPQESLISPNTKIINISSRELAIKGGYQNIQRYQGVDLSMAADSETTLPYLLEAVKKLVTGDRQRVFDERGAKLAASRARALETARREAVYGWDASPVSVDRVVAEMWNVVKDEDWALAGDRGGPSGHFLWNFTKRYQRIQGGNATGIGFHAPASVGAALAHRKHGRFAVSFQTDGDLMYAPGVLWTAAHHRIPLLAVMHNNRAYHQEVMHLQRMSTRRMRDVTTAHVGNVLWDPFINYKKLAESMGVYSEGPIENPNDLGPALQRAKEVVKRGEPALVDVVTQPR